MPAVRRSARERRHASSYYEDAKKEIELRESMSPAKRRSPNKASKPSQKKFPRIKEEDGDDDSEMNTQKDEIDDHEVDQDESSSDEDDDQKSFKKVKKRTPKKPRKALVQVGTKPKMKNAPPRPVARGGKGAMTNLAKKVLDARETPENSLVAALLYSGKTAKNQADTTENLQDIARRVIATHHDNPNCAQANLLNLIFRAVGGTIETCIKKDVELEDMDNEEWTSIITNLVDEMRYTAADQVLFCADPNGAVHAARDDQNKEAIVTASSLGVREFRKVFEEFWFVLVTVTLTEGYAQDKEETEEETAGRFEIELVRDWIMRINELIEVAQPDIRAAAVAASLKMSLAALTRTVDLVDRIGTTTRQYNAANKARKGSSKAESLKFQLDSLKRSREDLETLVEDNLSAVFMNRYRDSNRHIRANNIQALSEMTLLRPDLYLRDKYLKYIGWTLSDKAACVRITSVRGLAAPFVAAAEKPITGSQSSRAAKIDIRNMANVIRKFLPRLADCTIDINIKVQEEAMALFLLLDRANFLEDFEDDALWEQINNRALASDTTPTVRRDALYFIIDQLEAFDFGENEDTAPGDSKKWSKDKNASLTNSADKVAANKLDTLAGWVAHSLTDGPIPMDKIRIELTDYIVDSLRAMPEHQALVTTWSPIMKAIHDCEVSGNADSERAEIAKQRVLVRMLARAVQAEVGAVASDFFKDNVDPDLADLEGDHLEAKIPKSKAVKAGASHESLSVALLKTLPVLLLKFKADPHILTSVTSLPRFLLPSVASLPQRKNDFLDLIKGLGDIYLHSGNETVLQNIAESFSLLARGDHVRAQDTQAQLQKVGGDLSARLLDLLRPEKKAKLKKGVHSKSKRRKSVASSESDGKEENESSEIHDKEFAISMCLRRLCILAKRVDLSKVLSEETNSAVSVLDSLRDSIIEGISDRLKARQVVISKDEGENVVKVPEIWKDCEEKSHRTLAKSVKDALGFLLVSIAWSLREAQESDPMASSDLDETMDEGDEDTEMNNHPIALRRDQLVDFINLCFYQFLPDEDDSEDLYSDIQMDFSDSVQTAAIQTAADLRQLLPKQWRDASSSLLRACALTDDDLLVGGSIRYLRSRELDLRDIEDQDVEDKGRVLDLLLPFCRNFAANWLRGERREAGYVLVHIVGSGQASQQLLTTLSRIVKRIDPVHLLESHMACLRISFDDWLNNEPVEPESESPTDEEMVAFEEAEKEHREKFNLMLQQAGRLSQSLGVGKVDKQLESPLIAFVREGMRFAFSTEMRGDEEPLLPGGRLTFLSLTGKYVTWIKKLKSFHEVVVQNILEREEDLRSDPEFDQAHEDDLEALSAFRKIIGLKDESADTPAKSPRSTAFSHATDGTNSDEDSLSGGRTTPSKSIKRVRLSRGNSVGSDTNRSHTQTLSPLMEEENSSGNDEEGHELSRAAKRTRLTKVRKSSVASAITTASWDREAYETTIEEEASVASSE